MSSASVQSVPRTVSAQNAELIQQLSKSDSHQKILYLNKETGALSIESQKVEDVSWAIFAFLRNRKIDSWEFISSVSDTALNVLGSTLQILGGEEAYRSFEQKRMSSSNAAASASAASASASAKPPTSLLQKQLVSLFCESIKHLFLDRAPSTAVVPTDPVKLKQLEVVEHVAAYIQAFNEIREMSLEGIKLFVQDLINFAAMNGPAFKATVEQTEQNLYIKAFDPWRYEEEEDSFKDAATYDYPFETEHEAPLINYHLCHRAMQYNVDGSFYVHFTKKKLRDPNQPFGQDRGLGNGSYKIVSIALRIDQIEERFLASASSDSSLMEESQRLDAFHDVAGVLKFYYGVTYFGRSRSDPNVIVKKYRMLTNYCNQGTLKDAVRGAWAIKRRPLSEADKVSCSQQLVDVLNIIHERKWVYRDLKLDNLFLHRTAKGVLQLFIGDFGGAYPQEDLVNRCPFQTTPPYASPEVIEILNRHKHFDMSKAFDGGTPLQDELLAVNTPELDVWGLGCVLWEIYEGTELPWVGAYRAHAHQAHADNRKVTDAECIEKMFEQMIKSRSNPLPFDDKKQNHVIIRNLMKTNPKERLSLKELRVWLNGFR